MGTLLLRRVETAGMAGRLDGLSGVTIGRLYVMALNAHDTGTKRHPAGVYFRGWRHLASATGYGEDPDSRAAEESVRRSIRELVDAGLVKPEGRLYGARHGYMCYSLTL